MSKKQGESFPDFYGITDIDDDRRIPPGIIPEDNKRNWRIAFHFHFREIFKGFLNGILSKGCFLQIVYLSFNPLLYFFNPYVMFKIIFYSDLNTNQAVERIQAEFPPGEDRDEILNFIQSSQRGLVKKTAEEWKKDWE